MKNKEFSRRRFLTAGSLGLCGVWAGASEILPARALRGWIEESRRSVLDPATLPNPAGWNPNTLTAAWLGHATVLLNFYGLTILTDPVLFDRIGADTICGTIGPKRLVGPALTPDELPPVDLVLLSHAHMDHLDPATLRRVSRNAHVVTAHDTRDLLDGLHFRKSHELRWGDRVRIATAHGDVQVEAFEVKHWGARWKFDRRRGYNGYIVSREGKSILFGGDTAWTTSFRELRSKGPFEVAIMPIGAYDPWIMSHCSPEEAVRMANDAGARRFLPMHFGTFAFGREGAHEPLERLEAALDPARIGWRRVGETFVLA